MDDARFRANVEALPVTRADRLQVLDLVLAGRDILAERPAPAPVVEAPPKPRGAPKGMRKVADLPGDAR